MKERREKLAGSWKGRWDQDLLKEEIFFKNTIFFFISRWKKLQLVPMLAEKKL